MKSKHLYTFYDMDIHMVKQNKYNKETQVILSWECPICKDKGKSFKLKSMYEAQLESWIESHNETHKEE